MIARSLFYFLSAAQRSLLYEATSQVEELELKIAEFKERGVVGEDLRDAYHEAALSYEKLGNLPRALLYYLEAAKQSDEDSCLPAAGRVALQLKEEKLFDEISAGGEFLEIKQDPKILKFLQALEELAWLQSEQAPFKMTKALEEIIWLSAFLGRFELVIFFFELEMKELMEQKREPKEIHEHCLQLHAIYLKQPEPNWRRLTDLWDLAALHGIATISLLKAAFCEALLDLPDELGMQEAQLNRIHSRVTQAFSSKSTLSAQAIMEHIKLIDELLPKLSKRAPFLSQLKLNRENGDLFFSVIVNLCHFSDRDRELFLQFMAKGSPHWKAGAALARLSDLAHCSYKDIVEIADVLSPFAEYQEIFPLFLKILKPSLFHERTVASEIQICHKIAAYFKQGSRTEKRNCLSFIREAEKKWKENMTAGSWQQLGEIYLFLDRPSEGIDCWILFCKGAPLSNDLSPCMIEAFAISLTKLDIDPTRISSLFLAIHSLHVLNIEKPVLENAFFVSLIKKIGELFAQHGMLPLGIECAENALKETQSETILKMFYLETLGLWLKDIRIQGDAFIRKGAAENLFRIAQLHWKERGHPLLDLTEEQKLEDLDFLLEMNPKSSKPISSKIYLIHEAYFATHSILDRLFGVDSMIENFYWSALFLKRAALGLDPLDPRLSACLLNSTLCFACSGRTQNSWINPQLASVVDTLARIQSAGKEERARVVLPILHLYFKNRSEKVAWKVLYECLCQDPLFLDRKEPFFFDFRKLLSIFAFGEASDFQDFILKYKEIWFNLTGEDAFQETPNMDFPVGFFNETMDPSYERTI